MIEIVLEIAKLLVVICCMTIIVIGAVVGYMHIVNLRRMME
jgi:hypothetical protein